MIKFLHNDYPLEQQIINGKIIVNSNDKNKYILNLKLPKRTQNWDWATKYHRF